MLNIKKIKENEHYVLVLEGEIDASNSVELDEMIQNILENGPSHIVVDGTALEYISSAGLGVFMSYLEEFQEKNIQLVIFGLTEKVHQVFIILGLNQLIPIQSTKEEALGLIYES
jgi:anti-sigma B factor antagonist